MKYTSRSLCYPVYVVIVFHLVKQSAKPLGFMFSFSLTWEPMEAQSSKRYPSLKSLLNSFKLLLNFFLSGPHKSTVLDFRNFEFLINQEFCSFSLAWDPMGAKTSKTLLLPQITFESFQTFSEFSSQLSSQKYCF